MVTIADLQRISATALSKQILEEQNVPDPTVAVVDVRDNDHIGGHIKGSLHVPIDQLDAMMPTLVRKLQDKKKVVFHCALSQQRGPTAALRYLRERDGIYRSLGQSEKKPGESSGQMVYVLDEGFTNWQRLYGEDERLTENYSKELWQDY